MLNFCWAVYIQGYLVCNSSYIVGLQIFLKQLARFIMVWILYDVFCYFFHVVNWDIVGLECYRCLNGDTAPIVLYQSFWNFACAYQTFETLHVLTKPLKLCMCLPNLWNFACAYQTFETLYVLTKPLKLCMCLPNLWNFECAYQSFCNFAYAFVMVSRCSYGLPLILRWIFITFLFCALKHLLDWMVPMYTCRWYLMCKLVYWSENTFKLWGYFTMVWWCEHGFIRHLSLTVDLRICKV